MDGPLVVISLLNTSQETITTIFVPLRKLKKLCDELGNYTKDIIYIFQNLSTDDKRKIGQSLSLLWQLGSINISYGTNLGNIISIS